MLWTRKELIIAMNLYCKLPFGQFDRRNKTIIKVAEKIGRTPSSLAMKLSNLASLDPLHQKRGIKGLKGASRKDKEIWEEFNNNWENLIRESEEELEKLSLNEEENEDILEEIEEEYMLKTTEKETVIKIRKGQSFFRKTVLSAYNNRCCLTGIPITEFLIASHILPWNKFPQHRLNPRNGLCLARTHDVAFDRGLISFDENYRLIISSYLKSFLPDQALEMNFMSYKNQIIKLPEKFLPDLNFLSYHRENIFRS